MQAKTLRPSATSFFLPFSSASLDLWKLNQSFLSDVACLKGARRQTKQVCTMPCKCYSSSSTIFLSGKTLSDKQASKQES